MHPVIKNLAVLMESLAEPNGLHIALTGGQLYKDGPRKDIDFVIYHANSEEISGLTPTQREDLVVHFYKSLFTEGFSNIRNFGRVTKCTYEGLPIDILYPEYTRLGEYIVEELQTRTQVSSIHFPQTEDRS